MSAFYYLAIDQGTHASRAVLFDDSGSVIHAAYSDVTLSRVKPGWVEQDPDEILHSVQEVLNGCSDSGFPVHSAALATQRSSVVCWDSQTGKALSPVLSWQDTRAEEYLDALHGRLDLIRQKTGLPLSPHYGASKLRWCIDRLPAVQRALKQNRLCAGPLASWLIFNMVDEHPFVCDPANASRTLLFNKQTLDWDDELIEWFGLDRHFLPRCVLTLDKFGNLLAFKEPVPLRIVTGDQPAALFAYGEIQSDTAYINAGTGAFVQRQLPEGAAASAGLLDSVVYHDKLVTLRMMEATVNGAGAALSWHLEKNQRGGEEKNLTNWMNKVVDTPLFLNGVGGLAAPYWRPDFPSRFIGDGGFEEKTVAIAESIVFLINVNLERMADTVGSAGMIIISGGLAQVGPLCQQLADLSGVTVRRYPDIEATAQGVAWLLTDHSRSWCDEWVEFPPKSNPQLQKRFADWQTAMQNALGE